MNINISKIAKMAKVSTATVSRVINNPEKVSAKTRERVESVISKLGYVPNQQARSLRSQQTKMIAIIVPHSADYLFTYPYFSIFLRETSLELSHLGYHLILTTDEPHNSVIDTYRVFTDKRLVDGFVVLDLKNEDERVDFLKLRNIPFVAVGRNERDKDISFVDTDNEGGAYIAGKYLARKGCSQVLFINGPADQSVSLWRERGFQKAAQEMNFTFHVRNGDFVEKSGFEITKKHLGQFDGIFAASDLMAIGALKALREEGVSLPVVGFDDIPISSDVSPSLTTVHQPIDEVGRRAAINLVRLISEDHTETTILPVELIVRESSEVGK